MNGGNQVFTNMFLSQIDSSLIRHTQINRQLPNEKHGQIGIAHQQITHNRHRNHTYRRSLKGRGIRQIILLRKTGPITKVLHRLNHPNNLTATSDSILVDFDLAFQQTHHLLRFIAFAID